MTRNVASSFPTKRLKRVVELRRSRVNGSKECRQYIGLENIEPWTGKHISNSVVIDRTAISSLSNAFERGDVLFGKLRPYLAKAWVAEFPGWASTEFLVLKPVEVLASFLRYVCLWRNFIDKVDASTFGSKMPRADWGCIGNISIPVPGWREQRAVADFLDRETARIDELITAKEHVLELLSEKRQSLLTHAVTRGLDPSVTMRDSDVSWLGEIPAHWETRKIARLFRERDQRGEPNLPLLEVSINAGVKLREFSGNRIESTAADFNTYKVARRWDIVFNKMRMWQGAVGVAPEDGLVSPDYVVAAPVCSMSAGYAGLLFRTDAFSVECARRSHGIVWDRLRLYWDGFRDIEVSLPSPQEQAAIVAYVDRQTAKLDRLTNSAEKTVDLLKERRSTLIAAVVSGQIETKALP